MIPPERAILVLEDGSVFRGRAIGARGRGVGEVVFNTAITGYQEILTDPSYARQIITFTHPHIGNVGTNAADMESRRVWATGLVVRDLSSTVSNWRSEQSLEAFLVDQNVVGIADIDTRRLTRILRDRGAMAGCIASGDALDEDAARQAADAFPGLQGMDLAGEVSIDSAYEWDEGAWAFADGGYRPAQDTGRHVVAYDFGVKRNILRLLAERGCQVTVVPARTPAAEVLAMRPHGVFLSNGPGDPEPCDYAIDNTRALLDAGMPLFGICLGFQILSLASGARTLKMGHGHHGANHPIRDLRTGRVSISSQNHGFAVDADSLPECMQTTHISLFDGTLQGARRIDKPAFGVQGHPEASPGPHDLEYLFDHFVELLSEVDG